MGDITLYIHESFMHVETLDKKSGESCESRFKHTLYLCIMQNTRQTHFEL